MMIPTVHLNGTGKDALVDQVTDAARLLNKALVAMSDTYPNGRDYYPQGPDAIARAQAEHRARVERVTGVRDEFMAIAEQIANGVR